MIYHIINLEKRKDRLEYVHKHLNDLNLPHVIHRGVELKPGWKGCRQSHLELMKQYTNGKEPFCILEDDVQFLINPTEIIERALYEIDPDWDALFLGASPQSPQKRYSEHLYELKDALCLHAVIWNNQRDAIPNILRNIRDEDKIDVFISREIMPYFNCYLISPLVATQIQTQSDTCGRSDVSTIEKNYKLFCH